MKVVNPIGRKLNTGAEFGMRGCICSSGQFYTAIAYSCSGCGCDCDNGELNRSANDSIARYSRNYVNI